jgi:hypothetical protein
MRLTCLLCPVIFLGSAACGSAPMGTLYARISADRTLASAFTTDDDWSLSFSHVVVAVRGFTVIGGGVAGITRTLDASKLIDFAKDSRLDLDTNSGASARSYDQVSLVLGRATADDNVDVDADLLGRVGASTLYFEGTATKQSTTRQFQLGLPASVTYSTCMPGVTVEALGSAVVDFRVYAQRAFLDDAGLLRFDPWALADAAPQDGLVVNSEAAAVQTSTLPPAQYGATSGSLITVLQKRSLQLVGLGDSGTCAGQ